MNQVRTIITIALANAALLTGVLLLYSANPAAKTPTPQVIAPTLVPTAPPSSPDATPAPDPISEPSPTPDSRCLVRVKGRVYDLTRFRNQHEGGDIFVCGTDMTDTFYSEHDDSILRDLEKYAL